MYPGVPLVSHELFGLYILAIPRSVILMYPLESNTKFSGLISLWIILLAYKSSRPKMMQAIKNSIYYSPYLMWFHWNYDCQYGILNLHPPLSPALNTEYLCLGMQSAYWQWKANWIEIEVLFSSLHFVHSFWS